MQFHVIVTQFITPEHEYRVVLEQQNVPAADADAYELNRSNCIEYGFSPEYFVFIIDCDVPNWAFRTDGTDQVPDYVAVQVNAAYERWSVTARETPEPEEPGAYLRDDER